MTREQFEAALVKAPEVGTSGEMCFDFTGTPGTVCPAFRYTTVYEWDDTGRAMEECWQAYLTRWEANWDD